VFDWAGIFPYSSYFSVSCFVDFLLYTADYVLWEISFFLFFHFARLICLLVLGSLISIDDEFHSSFLEFGNCRGGFLTLNLFCYLTGRCDILIVILNNDPTLLRSFLVHQTSHSLFSELVRISWNIITFISELSKAGFWNDCAQITCITFLTAGCFRVFNHKEKSQNMG